MPQLVIAGVDLLPETLAAIEEKIAALEARIAALEPKAAPAPQSQPWPPEGLEAEQT